MSFPTGKWATSKIDPSSDRTKGTRLSQGCDGVRATDTAPEWCASAPPAPRRHLAGVRRTPVKWVSMPVQWLVASSSAAGRPLVHQWRCPLACSKARSCEGVQRCSSGMSSGLISGSSPRGASATATWPAVRPCLPSPAGALAGGSGIADTAPDAYAGARRYLKDPIGNLPAGVELTPWVGHLG